MTLNHTPGDWKQADATEGYEFNRDNGSISGPESDTLYSLDFSHEPGEVWEIRVKASISSENTDGVVVLEILDTNDNYIDQEILPTYSGQNLTATLTIPTYVVNDGFGSPADSSANPEYRLQAAGSDGFNYWVFLEAVRVRDAIDQNSRYQDSPDSLNSGQL